MPDLLTLAAMVVCGAVGLAIGSGVGWFLTTVAHLPPVHAVVALALLLLLRLVWAGCRR